MKKKLFRISVYVSPQLLRDLLAADGALRTSRRVGTDKSAPELKALIVQVTTALQRLGDAAPPLLTPSPSAPHGEA